MRLLIIDDHILFREGLIGLLNGQPDIEVVGQAGTVADAVRLARELCPDLVLMDFGLPDGSGLEATQAILAERPDTSIVFLTVHDQDDRLFAAIRAGAKGYLLKNVALSNLLAYLRGIEQGEVAISLTMTSQIFKEFLRLRPPTEASTLDGVELTWREEEVLRELAAGATNQEIAEHLVIAENTVKVHVHHILSKLNLRNRREAINYARNHGLI